MRVSGFGAKVQVRSAKASSCACHTCLRSTVGHAVGTEELGGLAYPLAEPPKSAMSQLMGSQVRLQNTNAHAKGYKIMHVHFQFQLGPATILLSTCILKVRDRHMHSPKNPRKLTTCHVLRHCCTPIKWPRYQAWPMHKMKKYTRVQRHIRFLGNSVRPK